VADHPVPHSRRFAIGDAQRGRSLSDDGSGAPQPIRRSLIGFDGSVASMGALHYAARAARHNRGCLVVVSVVRKPVEVVAAWPVAVHAHASESPEQCALVALRAAVESLPRDVSVVTFVCHGRAGPVLLREAARHLCDAIVVGAPSGEWGRLTGGVARYLRRRAAVDVIVVPRPNAGALVGAPLVALDPVEFGL
jgi:nucleotide-binding universal stress UspA family protein